ncbi:hypothetical protein NDN08_008036 [Rhodosorus marinus]|uniref:Uncharacterized protein n=1 Tax=Rhodosorus marinus TaxID=101924 RepID=A0AAV8V227_9RHOD|nr:hypothetical protein NDN08_008036 [Rhodosorus marinus]
MVNQLRSAAACHPVVGFVHPVLFGVKVRGNVVSDRDQSLLRFRLRGSRRKVVVQQGQDPNPLENEEIVEDDEFPAPIAYRKPAPERNSLKSPSTVFVRFSGFIALIVAIMCCSYAFWRPERVINIAHPVYIAFSSFFLGIFVSQFSSRVQRFPVVTLSISIFLKLIFPIAAIFVSRLYNFKTPETASLAVLSAGPVAFGPSVAIASRDMYLSYAIALCKLTYIAAFAFVPASVWLSTAGRATASPTFVGATVSLPFIAGLRVFRSVPVRHGGLLGRLSVFLSWMFCIPQTLTIVARFRMELSTLVNPIETITAIAVFNLVAILLAVAAGKAIGQDNRLSKTMLFTILFPSSILCSAIALSSQSVRVPK